MNKSALLAKIAFHQEEIDTHQNAIKILLTQLNDLDEVNQPNIPVVHQQDNPDNWMTPKQVCRYLNITISTFYLWLQDGKLPQGIAFSAKSKRWRASDIINYKVRTSKIPKRDEFFNN